MIGPKRIVLVAAIAVAGFFTIPQNEESVLLGGSCLVGEAKARVGRPLTPLSYAGIARRTSRRVARRTTVRLNALPGGCHYGPYNGASYWNCDGVYYEQQGNVYVQVVFE